ncbi:MAG TPA: HAD hydrolase-like protein [Legionellaceae bacterium]|nr:HAD hydrolase-like protein [Legionellaceae bacterium]
MLNLIFDLDGTLIDSRLRLYTLFQHLVPTSVFSYEAYWERKQNKISHQDILQNELNYSPEKIQRFHKDWMALIETDDFLSLDKAFDAIHVFLQGLLPFANLYVCTARQNRLAVHAQLEDLQLKHFFTDILVTEQIKTKEFLIKNAIHTLSQKDWMIGDTGKDIQAGKMLKIRTCAVLSGFLNEKSLLPYQPDYIIPHVIEFHHLLETCSTNSCI